MAGSVNKVILIGNLGADPEIRRTQDGRPIANLRVATSESWRDKTTGERKEKTEWHRVVDLQRGPVQDRRAISQEGLEGLSGRRAADAQMAGQGRPRQIFDRGGAAGLQLAAHHARHARRRRRRQRRQRRRLRLQRAERGARAQAGAWPAPASATTWTTRFRSDGVESRLVHSR